MSREKYEPCGSQFFPLLDFPSLPLFAWIRWSGTKSNEVNPSVFRFWTLLNQIASWTTGKPIWKPRKSLDCFKETCTSQIYIYICIYIYTYTYIHIYIHTYIYIYTYIHTYKNTYTYIYTYMYTHFQIYIFVYICIYIYVGSDHFPYISSILYDWGYLLKVAVPVLKWDNLSTNGQLDGGFSSKLGAVTMLGRQRNELCRMRVCLKNVGYLANWSFFKGTYRSTSMGDFWGFRIWRTIPGMTNNQWPLRRLGCFMTKSVMNWVVNDSSWMYIQVYTYIDT